MALMDVPGLGAYLQKRQLNEQAPLGELQQVQAAHGLMAAMEKRKQGAALQQALAESGGDVEKAIELAVRSGNVEAAQRLAPLAKMAQEKRAAAETRSGLAALLSPQSAPAQNPMVPGPGASVMAGSGEVPPTPAPAANPTQARLAHLDKLMLIYANNPTVLRMVEAEKGKIAATAEKAPQRRERIAGGNAIQEEYINGQWREIGRGPRFSSQITMPAPAPTVTEIQDPNDPNKNIKIDAKTGKKIGDAPIKPPSERPLPAPLQKQLTEAAELSDATMRFTSTFKDEYGGYKLGVIGDAVNWAKRTFGDDSMQAQWWQDYELHQSQIRNKLFGSALTAPEIAAWNKSAINPGMEQKQIRLNLDRRAKLEQTGLDRLMKGAAAGRYSKEQIEAFTGRSLADTAATTPAPTLAPAPTPAPAKFEEGKTYVDGKGNRAVFRGGKFVPVK